MSEQPETVSQPTSDNHRGEIETPCLSENLSAQIVMRALGRRKHISHHGTLCSRCLKNPPANPKDRYCSPCRASYNRDRRKILRAERGAQQIAQETQSSKV